MLVNIKHSALKAVAQHNKEKQTHAHDSNVVSVLQVSRFHELMNLWQDGPEKTRGPDKIKRME